MKTKAMKLLRRMLFGEKQETQVSSIVPNVFKTNFGKKALLSYLVEPFRSGIKLTHTAYQECFAVAQILSKLGYDIDVVPFTDSIDHKRYSAYTVIFGFGEPLENSFYHDPEKRIITIYYGTGCQTDFSNTMTLKRVLEVYHKRHRLIPQSARLAERSWRMTTVLSSALVVLGNEYTKSTYLLSDRRGEVYSLPAFYYSVISDGELPGKDFSTAASHFLWFGSAGLIHKGLDLVLEVFAKMPHLTLHVCGVNDRESEFIEAYHEELFGCANIFNYGFVDISADVFKSLMLKCGFVILPSITEGGAPSVLTAMGNGGCVPLVPKEAGLDVEDFGYTLGGVSSEEIATTVERCSYLSGEELLARSKLTLEYARGYHSLENYKVNMHSILSRIILGHSVAGSEDSVPASTESIK